MADRKEARRRLLIDAGIVVIGDVGIANTRLRNICAEAGLTDRYFYESFPNLQAFATAVVQEVALQLGSRVIARWADADSGPAHVRIVAEEMVRFIEEDPRRGRILFLEPVRAGGELAESRKWALYSSARLVKLFLEGAHIADIRAAAAPLLTGLHSDDVVGIDPMSVTLVGATNELLTAWIEGTVKMPPTQLIEYLLLHIDQTIRWNAPT